MRTTIGRKNPYDEYMLPARYQEYQTLEDGFRVVQYYLYRKNLVVLILLDVTKGAYKVHVLPVEKFDLKTDIREQQCLDIQDNADFITVKNEIRKYYDENSENFLKIQTNRAMLKQRKEIRRKIKEWLI